MTPSPISKYQRILRKIVFILERIITENGLGEVFNAPCDVYILKDNTCQFYKKYTKGDTHQSLLSCSPV